MFPGSNSPSVGISASRQDMETIGGDLPGNRLFSWALVHSSRVPISRAESHLLMTIIA